jgi:membrane protease YdiL (CAAX protease family)
VTSVTVLSPSVAALNSLSISTDAGRLAQTGPPTAPAEGLAAFLGFTALVLTGFLVLARLSQGVVDGEGAPGDGDEGKTAEHSDEGETAGHNDGLHVPAGPAPGESGPSDDGTETASPGRSTATEPESVTSSPGATEPGGATREDRPKPAEDPAPDATTPDATTARADSDRRDTDPVGPDTDPVGPDTDPVGPDTDPVGPDTDPVGPDTDPAGRGVQAASIPPAALLANVALTQGLFGGILAAAAWFFQVPGTALGLAGGRVAGLAAVGVGFAFGVALWVGNEVASALADAAGAGYDEGLRRMLAPSGPRGWAILLGGVLPVIALVEEFLFRAAAVGAASATIGATGPAAAGAWALAVVSSLAFALGHGAQGRVGVVVTGALGFVLAAGFVLSGSFLVVVVAHYVVNALEFLCHEWVGLPDPVWS